MAEALRSTQAAPTRTTAKRLMDRWATMQQQIQLFGHDWDDIVNLIAPMCSLTRQSISPGDSRTRYMFDPTAMTDNTKLAAHLMGNVTNQAIEWHQMLLRDYALDDDQESAAWLAQANRHQMRVYNASNFYQSMYTFYLHYASLGTAALFCGDAQTAPAGTVPGQVFLPVPHGTYGLLEDPDGRVKTLFRLVRFSPLQAIQLFEGQVSARIRELARDERTMDSPMSFLHATFPREDWRQGSMNNRDLPFASIYMELDTQYINDESGYHEFPYAVARWEKLADSPWGFGPGHMALPDVRTLNAMKELQIQMLALWAQPPLKQVHEGVLGNISLEPLAINVVRRPDDLTPLEITGRPDLVQISQEDLRLSIHNIFHISGLEAIPPADGTPMTAYEIAQRVATQARLMGPAFHRLTVEALTPLIDRSFGLEWRKGQIPRPPAQVLEAAARRGGQVDIEYVGPLARAQKSADLQAILQVYSTGAQMEQARQLALASGGQPTLFDLLDDDVAIRKAADAANLPKEVVRDLAAVARIRAAREAALQQQQQAQQQQQTATTLKDISPFLQTTHEMARAA